MNGRVDVKVDGRVDVKVDGRVDVKVNEWEGGCEGE